MAPRAQTLKQAKAAYKSRSGNTLTDREKKQLERSLELDRRAWRIKEAEKRKAEAKAKREEQQRREREAGAGMTSQRRCDRFGFAGSQMHLGAFFGGGGGARVAVGKDDAPEAVGKRLASEDFGDELDDDTLLDAVSDSNGDGRPGPARHMSTELSPTEPTTSQRSIAVSRSVEPPKPMAADFDSFWDDLDSSTQIARDLAEESTNPASKPPSPNTSFGSGEFDLSVEDIEEAQANDQKQTRVDTDRKLMPPPALPSKPAPPKKTPVQPYSRQALSRPQARPQPPRAMSRPSATATKPAFAPYLGFTLAELESYVEDDLQLTQVDPV